MSTGVLTISAKSLPKRFACGDDHTEFQQTSPPVSALALSSSESARGSQESKSHTATVTYQLGVV